MITGVHTILYSQQAEQLRKFFGEILPWKNVDAGGGWSIDTPPASELAVHPRGALGRGDLVAPAGCH